MNKRISVSAVREKAFMIMSNIAFLICRTGNNQNILTVIDYMRK